MNGAGRKKNKKKVRRWEFVEDMMRHEEIEKKETTPNVIHRSRVRIN